MGALRSNGADLPVWRVGGFLRQAGGSRLEIEGLNLDTGLRTQVHDGDTNTC